MTKEEAVERAGSISSLSRILGISNLTIRKWGKEVPYRYEQNLRVLRPEWFGRTGGRGRATPYDRLMQVKALATVIRRLSA